MLTPIFGWEHDRTKPGLGTQINWSHPLTVGLVFYALFNENNGEAFSLVPPAVQGTTVGTSLGWTAFQYGGTRKWYYGNGSINQQAVFWPTIMASTPSVITVAASGYPLAHNGNYNQEIIRTPLELQFFSNNQINYAVQTLAGNKNASYTLPSGTIPDGSQVVMTYFNNGGNMNARVWFNGARVSDFSFGSAYSPLDWVTAPGTDVLVAGNSETVGSINSSMDGPIYWVAVWNYQLTDAHVAALWADPYAFIAPDALVSWWAPTGIAAPANVPPLILGRPLDPQQSPLGAYGGSILTRL